MRIEHPELLQAEKHKRDDIGTVLVTLIFAVLMIVAMVTTARADDTDEVIAVIYSEKDSEDSFAQNVDKASTSNEKPCLQSEADNYSLESVSCDSVASDALQEQICKSPYVEIARNMSLEEIDLALRVMWGEANNQGVVGNRAVLEVIFNRCMSGGFPNDVYHVLSQRGQFATWSAAVNHRVSYTAVQTDAMQLVTEETPVLPSTSYVYFSRGKHSWMHNCIKIGAHWFGTK